MPTGTVKWFNTTKGYGFIAPDDGGKDVFVHISAVERAGLTGLPDNMKISYDLREGRDGRAPTDPETWWRTGISQCAFLCEHRVDGAQLSGTSGPRAEISGAQGDTVRYLFIVNGSFTSFVLP